MSLQLRRLFYVLAPLGVVLLAVAPGSPEEPAFSRSRWLLERRGTYLSSRGLIPSTEPLPSEVLRAPALVPQVPELPAAARPKWVRVSRDVLAPDVSAAQAETQTEPYLAVDPERETRMLAAYQEGRYATGGARALTYAFSKNGGRTWTEALVPGLSRASGGTFQRATDPWVAYGPGGRAYYCSLLFNETGPENGVFVSASRDGGRTWGPPVAVHRGDADNFDDKQAMTVDTLARSPYRGRIYVGWDTVGDLHQLLRMAWSADGGASFSPPAELESTGVNIGVIPLVGPGGVVHAVWTHGDSAQGPLVIHASRSEDGGATWSPPVRVADLQEVEVRLQRTGEILPTAAIDPRNGRIYVAWMDSRFTPGIPQIVLSRSNDGGRTWSEPQRVSDGPGDAASFIPALAVNGEGRVAVSYYSMRNDPTRNFLVDAYVTLSRDGVNFGASRRVSPASWDVRFAAVAGGFFLGDYHGLAAGRKLFHGLWIATAERSKLDPTERQPDAFLGTIRP